MAIIPQPSLFSWDEIEEDAVKYLWEFFLETRKNLFCIVFFHRLAAFTPLRYSLFSLETTF